jgi:hypothetical protein
MGSALDWIRSHETVLWWLSGLSLVTFVGSLIAIPWLVVRIPADYFLHRRFFLHGDRTRHPALRISLLILKNALGVLLLPAGAAMLVLPGQGVLTIVVGLMLIDFPGKFALERWLVELPAVLSAINWMRAKAGHPPLRSPKEFEEK